MSQVESFCTQTWHILANRVALLFLVKMRLNAGVKAAAFLCLNYSQKRKDIVQMITLSHSSGAFAGQVCCCALKGLLM